MSAIVLENPYFCQNDINDIYDFGGESKSKVIGYDGGGYYHIARYEFTTLDSGASHIQFELASLRLIACSSVDDASLCFYIGTSDSSHLLADSSSVCTGIVSISLDSDGYNFRLTGEADIVLLPNTKYYVWIFSNLDATSQKWCHFSAEYALTGIGSISGASGLVHIYNGSGWEEYQAYIYNGTGWDLYMPYIYNGSEWDMMC